MDNHQSQLQKSFPIELPFELQNVTPKTQQQESHLFKFQIMLNVVLDQMRGKTQYMDILKKISSILRNRSEVDEKAKQKYEQFLTLMVKVKSMSKALSKQDVRDIVARQIMDVIFMK